MSKSSFAGCVTSLRALLNIVTFQLVSYSHLFSLTLIINMSTSSSNSNVRFSFVLSCSSLRSFPRLVASTDSFSAPQTVVSKANDVSSEPKHKVVLVTGGNRGIGLGVTRGLAKLDANNTVIFSTREEKKGQAVVEKLKKEGLNNGSIPGWALCADCSACSVVRCVRCQRRQERQGRR